MEHKETIVAMLSVLIKRTRAGENLKGLYYNKDGRGEETVVILWSNDYRQEISVTADSGLALIKDVLERIS